MATTSDSDVSARFAHIDARFTSTDKELHEIRGQMFSFGSQLSSVAAGQDAMLVQLKDMAAVQNRPAPSTNWWALIGAVGVIVGLLGSYLTVVLEPVKGDVVTLHQQVEALRDAQGVRLGTIARFEEWIRQFERRE